MYLEFTKVPVSRTAGELNECLRDAGAVQIMTEYEGKRESAITFTLEMMGQLRPFRLPIRTANVYCVLQKQRSPRTRERMAKADRDQAERIAWRQTLIWVRAQLAMIQTGMVEAGEVFLPYARMSSGETYYERLAAQQFKALPGPESGGEK
jgi:hypothetical protein